MSYGNKRRKVSPLHSVRNAAHLDSELPASVRPPLAERAFRRKTAGSVPPFSPNVTVADRERRLATERALATTSFPGAVSSSTTGPADACRPLRLDTAFNSPMSAHQGSHPRVDLFRLHEIYEAHRGAFWTTIANQYSPNGSVSATELEHAFFSQYNTSPSSTVLPTPTELPNISPEVFYSPPVHATTKRDGFSAINRIPTCAEANKTHAVSRCAVSSLLNAPT